MKIDRDVERAVRSALAGAVGGEPERFDSAMAAIVAEGPDFFARALTLAHSIDSAALFLVHEGERPDDEQLDYLARRFTEQESDWIDIDETVTRSYLQSLADRKSPSEETPAEDVVFASFAVGGWLLSAFLPANESWTGFLDSILDVLESLPAN